MNLIIALNRYLQIECFIVFWRPALILSFCNLSSSFAGEMWTNQIDFNKPISKYPVQEVYTASIECY